MKIVADENIPHVAHYFGDQGELFLKAGRLITRDDLFDADMLLTRSVTKVNELLLHDTPVKFVGSTVAGLDHLDTEYLAKANIDWYAAEGCNATSVAEYVVCVVAALQKQGLLQGSQLRAAVIGVGRVGRLVVDCLKVLGFEVLACDPFRSLSEDGFAGVALGDIADCDLICLHTPLTQQGEFPTYHLVEKNFLQRQKPQTVLLNAGRGAVINSADLKQYGTHLNWCLDVFENEPEIDLAVLERAIIATPHIAGHSVESKLRGLDRVYRAAFQRGLLSGSMKEFIYPEKVLYCGTEIKDWRDAVLKIFDPRVETQWMKKNLIAGTETFDLLRKKFGERHEFNFVKLTDLSIDERQQQLLARLMKKD